MIVTRGEMECAKLEPMLKLREFMCKYHVSYTICIHHSKMINNARGELARW